jgi:acetoin utilization deacetylase AcuC-like enzyme
LKAFYSDQFVLPLPPGHRFPMAKYEALRRRVELDCPAIRLRAPPAATDEELALAHDLAYVRRVVRGELSSREQRAIGFPWSSQLVERSRRSAGATMSACRTALRDGIAVNLAGGTHHAHADFGQGYCVFNDVAVAARVLQSDAGGTRRPRIAIVDLDVHQGNGTANIFGDDPSVFTLSLHGASNFPFRKACSDLDVALPDATGDDDYLEALERALGEMLRRFQPGFLIYLAGADAHEGDRLGRLALTTAGLHARDRSVFDLAHRLRIPIAVAMAGGYGRDIGVTVEVHLNTVREALRHFERVCADGTIGITA